MSVTGFDSGDVGRPIVELFERAARRYPQRTAVTDSRTTLSYAELWAGVSGLAGTIAAHTGPGDLVGIALPAGATYPMAMLACLAAGRPFVALDPHYPHEWRQQVLEDARPAMIIGDGDLRSVPRSGEAALRPTRPGVDEPACVIFTSGSTGRPKGIVNSQRNLLQRVAQAIDTARVTPDDRFLTLASPCTIVGVRDMLTALLAGASVHLIDPQRAGAREFLTVVRTEGITILFAFPALLRSIVPARGERAPETLRLVRIGGDTTLWSDIDRLRAWLAPRAEIQSIYAATEAPMMQWLVDEACRGDDLRIPIGSMRPGNHLSVIDERGRPARAGEVGELIVDSPYVALGLWTGGRCIPGSIERGEAAGHRVFRTGDLVRQRPDGLLERIGRTDRQVKVRGTRVDLDGVEAILRRAARGRDVAVLARSAAGADGDRGATLVAYVTADSGAPAGLVKDLKERMRSAPPAMRLAHVYLVATIPQLPTSKVDLRALMALDAINVEQERNGAGDAAAGGDPIARTVAQAWQRVLHAPPGGPDDDFFDAGGDSLNAIRLVNELERALGFELPLTLVSDAPTFDGLCAAIRNHRTGYVPLVPLKPGDDSPPVFIIHGLGGTVAGLLPTARRMNYAGAVIGIQARGLSRGESPHASVEAMADEYLKAVKARQPDGPYYLCGYSFGGLVAFEMARRLRESGEEVALAGLFDTTISPLRRPLRAWLSIARRRIQVVDGSGVIDALREVVTSWPLGMVKVSAAAFLASIRYHPGFYPGELTLFTPQEREPRVPSLAAIWRAHASAVTMVETAGAHATMFSARHADSTAQSLTRCLRVRPAA